jgi:hypothetical protein
MAYYDGKKWASQAEDDKSLTGTIKSGVASKIASNVAGKGLAAGSTAGKVGGNGSLGVGAGLAVGSAAGSLGGTLGSGTGLKVGSTAGSLAATGGLSSSSSVSPAVNPPDQPLIPNAGSVASTGLTAGGLVGTGGLNTSAKPTDSNEKGADILPVDTTQDGQKSIADMINEMAEAQKQARYAELDAAFNQNMGSLDEREAGLGDQYYNAKNKVGAASDLGAYNFAQRAASLGIKGSAAQLPEVYRNAAYQGNIGALETQEQADRSAIARDRLGLKNALATDKANAGAGIDADSMQNYINQMNADRAYNYQSGRDAVTDSQWETTYNSSEDQRAKDNDYRNRSLDENIREFNANYGMDLKKMNTDQAQQAIDNAYKMGQLTLSQRSQALNELEFTHKQQIDAQNTYNTAYNQVAGMMTEKNTGGGMFGTDTSKYTNNEIIQYVMSLTLSDQQKADLLNSFGL